MVEGSGGRIIEFESFKLKKVVYIPFIEQKSFVNAITSTGTKVLFDKDEVTINYKEKTVLKGHKLKSLL